MSRKTPEEKLQELEQKKAQLAAQITRTKAQVRGQERKRDTRRKIIAGALALEHAEQNPDFRKELTRLLEQHVTRPQDRELFDL
jgi:hypothetical protein